MTKERPTPKTVIREKETAHTEALRANAIYDALLDRRANWYRKYRPSLESVPEVTPKKATRYGRQAVRLIEAAEKQGDFIQELREKNYKESTIKRWQKRTNLASRVLQEKFAGQGVALAGGKVETPVEKAEEAPPPIAPEERRTREAIMQPPVESETAESIYERLLKQAPLVEVSEKPRVDLAQMWQKTRERFKVKVNLKISERLRALGQPLSAEEAGVVLEKQKAAGKKRKEALGKIWERMRGISVLPSASAVKDWVDQIWAKAPTPRVKPLTKEEMDAALEAQRVEVQLPLQFKEISIKEVWGKLDKKNKVRLGIAAALIAGGAGIAYEIEGRHGQDWQWIVSHFSGIGAVIREIEITPTVAGIAEVTPMPIVTPEPEVVVKEEEVKKESEITEKIKEKAEVAVEEEKAPEDIQIDLFGRLIKEAWAAKQEAVELATQKVKEFAQAGVAIPEGSHPWGVSEQIAEQIIQGVGLEETEGVKMVVTDAVKDRSGWANKGEEAKPGDIVEFDPAEVADHLSARTKAIAQVKAVEGKLEVEVTDEDLGSLVSVVEFLRSL